MRMLPITLAACVLAIAQFGCQPPVTAAPTTTARGDTAYIIGCQESPRYCKEKAREVCPFGDTTIKNGVGGWYGDGEDFRRGGAPSQRRPNYKLDDWIIRCNQPIIGR